MINNKPMKKSDLSIKVIGDEVMIYDGRTKKVHMVNLVAQKIMEMCDGNHDIDQMVKEIEGSFTISGTDTDIRGDIEEILMQFEELNLFEVKPVSV